MRLLPRRTRMPAPRRVGMKFTAAVCVVALGTLTIAGIGVAGISQPRSHVDRVVRHDVASVQALADLSTGLSATEKAALALSRRPVATRGDGLGGVLAQVLVPRVGSSR